MEIQIEETTELKDTADASLEARQWRPRTRTALSVRWAARDVVGEFAVSQLISEYRSLL
jgi:hypothetical protein